MLTISSHSETTKAELYFIGIQRDTLTNKTKNQIIKRNQN